MYYLEYGFGFAIHHRLGVEFFFGGLLKLGFWVCHASSPTSGLGLHCFISQEGLGFRILSKAPVFSERYERVQVFTWSSGA